MDTLNYRESRWHYLHKKLADILNELKKRHQDAVFGCPGLYHSADS